MNRRAMPAKSDDHKRKSNAWSQNKQYSAIEQKLSLQNNKQKKKIQI